MNIGPFDLDRHVLVVAEIGNNHEGNFQVAQELVRKAADCGAGAVKFQTFRTERFVSRADAVRFDRLKSFELKYSHFEDLSRLARSLGLLFLSTPLDLGSAEFLEGIVDAYKIASGDNDFFPLLQSVCRTGKPVILSSGLADIEQVRQSKQFIEEQWRLQGFHPLLAVLHCVSSYPVPPEQANLAAIPFLAGELGCLIGYSDHTVGLEACKIAVALGAGIVEKHFTLDKNYSSFRDHHLSADPPDMRQLVQEIARVRLLLGKAEKKVQPSEATSAPLIRRSIAAARDLPQGHRLAWPDLDWLRPAGGLRPGQEQAILGRSLRRPLAGGEAIQLSDLE